MTKIKLDWKQIAVEILRIIIAALTGWSAGGGMT